MNWYVEIYAFNRLYRITYPQGWCKLPYRYSKGTKVAWYRRHFYKMNWKTGFRFAFGLFDFTYRGPNDLSKGF